MPALPARPPGPRTLTARHWASDTVLPVTLDKGADPVGHVDLPATAPAGDWDLRLAGDEERSVGRFQVEEFRLPTSRAAISGPKAIPVAPRSLPLDLALSYLSGGGASGTPVTLRTRVVPRSVEMPGYDGWRFDAEPVKPGLATLDGDGNEAGASASAQRAAEQPLTLGPAGTARVTASGWPAITATVHAGGGDGLSGCQWRSGDQGHPPETGSGSRAHRHRHRWLAE